MTINIKDSNCGQAICITLIHYNIEEMPINLVVIHQMVPLHLTV